MDEMDGILMVLMRCICDGYPRWMVILSNTSLFRCSLHQTDGRIIASKFDKNIGCLFKKEAIETFLKEILGQNGSNRPEPKQNSGNLYKMVKMGVEEKNRWF